MNCKLYILIGCLILLLITFYGISDNFIHIQLNFGNTSIYEEEFVEANDTTEMVDQGVKTILYWTTFFDKPFTLTGLNSCPNFKCNLTNDRSLINKSSAVIFHIRDFKWNDVPANRFRDQRYVFFLHESPHHTYVDVDKIHGFFNWTMTYRVDSDMPMYYGDVLRKNPYLNITENATVVALNSTEILGSNKKLVAWMVSNCNTPSKRELYVRKLQKYISVDIYGACGPLKCSKSSWAQCNSMIGENYKFYLAFENSLCKDYITEKYFGRVHLNSIPIVLKRSIVENILPENSFIATDDFKNPKELAWYLKDLVENDEKYLNYFKWRTQEYVALDPTETSHCLLCKKLWNKVEPKKFYKKMSSWWSDNVCDVTFVEKHLS